MKHINILSAVVISACLFNNWADEPRIYNTLKSDIPGRVIHSWIANSFARKKGNQFVPVTSAGIAVKPDGTVFSAGVAEAFGGVASYKDGKFVTKYDYDSGFGSSAFAVAVDDSYVYIGTGVGLFKTRLHDESYNRTPVIKGNINGLALHAGELYVSDTAADKILIFSTATMEEIRSLETPRPGPITVGADGRIWVIQGKPGQKSFNIGGEKIISFSKDGQMVHEITDFENPCALTFDPEGHLLVGGLNQHCQIWVYDVRGTPTKVDSIGAEGGIFSGEYGVYKPMKFHWIRGLGFDAAGNLYVANTFGSWYNTIIEAYSPSGKRLWYVYGLGNWLDTACSYPADEDFVYTKENVFQMH
jgi:sugar lactone lactonase YvrE